MHAFTFAAPASTSEALSLAGDKSAFLAGGTTLVDLMKLDVLTDSFGAAAGISLSALSEAAMRSAVARLMVVKS